MRGGMLLLAAALAMAPSGALQLARGDVEITTNSLPEGRVGVPYSASLSVKGGRPLYRWTVSGDFPPGLSIEPITGAVSGVPEEAGTFDFGVRVTDARGDSDTKSFRVRIRAGQQADSLVVSTTSLPAGMVGLPYSAPLLATGGAPPYSWSASGLPAGLGISSDRIEGTPAQPGTFPVTVEVTDRASASATKNLVINVLPALTITTAALPSGKAGSEYSAPLEATGGSPPYTWSIASGALPKGLSLNGSRISGTPASGGKGDFTLRVSDAAGASAVKALSIVIESKAPPLAISTGSLPDGRTGTAYNQTVTATGGTPPYSWSVISGTLPAGLTLGAGQITGTPTAGGTARFTLQVKDSAGETATGAFTITVASPLQIASPAALPAGAAHAPYHYKLMATGGEPPYSWEITAGSLPPGLTLADNTISGIPTADGKYSFSARVTDKAGGSESGSFSVTIAPGLTITSTSPLRAAAVGTQYSQALAALAGVPPYEWSVASGALPGGLSLDPRTGVLSGTPLAGGSFEFTVQVRDTAGASVSKPFTITVVSALTIATASPLASGAVGVAYTQSLGATAGTSPYTWAVTAGALPQGLTLDASSGVISGTPAATGTFEFTVQVRDSLSATASKVLAITIAPAIAIANVSPLPPGTAGQPYSHQLSAQGGVAPYTWSVTGGALPAGLALDGARGLITGTPQAAGDYEFTLRAADAAGGTASATATLHIGLVAPPAVAITGLPETAGPLAQPQVGVSIAEPYSLPLTGQLVLTFAPDATVPGDDPAIQFSTGGRTVDFSIPANSTQVSLPAPQIALQTGSVAGTITVAAVLKAGGVDATPSPAPVRTLRVARSAPVIRSLKKVTTATGFEIWITGYSPSRDLTQAAFRFTPAPGSNLRTTTATLPLADSARQWYEDPVSRLFGSQFTIVQPFTLQGSASAIGAIYVSLSNSAGNSEELLVPEDTAGAN